MTVRVENFGEKMLTTESVADQGPVTKKMPGRKWRKYLIGAEILPMVFTTGHEFEISRGVPFGAQLISFSLDSARNLIALVIEHDSFAAIDEGKLLPEFKIEARGI